MSDHDATAAHGGGHDTGHDDHHGGGHDTGHDDHHDGGTLGPIDWAMWGVGALGVIAALIVVAGFVVATDFVFFAGAG